MTEIFIPHGEREELEAVNTDIQKKRKDFFSSIENKETKKNIENYFSFLAEQDSTYFEDNEEGINQFEEDKNNFLSKNYNFNKESFDALIGSIINRKYLSKDIEKINRLGNFYGGDLEGYSKEVEELYNNFLEEQGNFEELLSLPREVRIKLCTVAKINIVDIMDGEVGSLTFDFKFSKEKINQEIYLNTTAGQLLPAEVQQVIENGVVYFRSGQLGEFFTENNKRLTIHQCTHITVSKLQSREDVLNKENEIKEKLGIFEEGEKLSLEDSIRLEAGLRGIDPEFALIAFEETLEETPEEKRKYVLENMLTEFDRIRGYYKLDVKENKKINDATALRLLYNLDSTNYKKNAIEYGIEESKITKKDKMGEYLNFSNIEGLDDVAKKLNVPNDILYAIFMNESSGKGLGKVITRFEQHIFDRYKKEGYSDNKAKKLATSYGGMQIMGFNYEKAGYNNVEEFVNAQTGPNSEKEQLKAFENFLKNTPGMISAMNDYNYHKIALLYNGENYKNVAKKYNHKFNYAEKIQNYVEKNLKSKIDKK